MKTLIIISILLMGCGSTTTFKLNDGRMFTVTQKGASGIATLEVDGTKLHVDAKREPLIGGLPKVEVDQ